MLLTRKFAYFCDIRHFKLTTRITSDNIIPGHIRFLVMLYNFWSTNIQIQHKEGLVLFLVYQYFQCNLTYQISLISLASLLYKEREQIFLDVPLTFWKIPKLVQGKKKTSWASLVVQWLGVRLPVQGTRVRALVREDPMCRGATEPVCHSC